MYKTKICNINLYGKEIKVPFLIVERLSDTFSLQPMQCPIGFASLRRGTILNG